jgi:hypothetical protein
LQESRCYLARTDEVAIPQLETQERVQERDDPLA